MKDINGVDINPGMVVKTQQPSGGILPPADSEVGVVEPCVDAFGKHTLCIRYRKRGNFDRFILLEGKINECVSEVVNN